MNEVREREFHDKPFEGYHPQSKSSFQQALLFFWHNLGGRFFHSRHANHMEYSLNTNGDVISRQLISTTDASIAAFLPKSCWHLANLVAASILGRSHSISMLVETSEPEDTWLGSDQGLRFLSGTNL